MEKQSIYKIHYRKGADAFHADLIQAANGYFQESGRKRNGGFFLHLKAVFFLLLFLSLYASIYIFEGNNIYWIYALLGFLNVPLVLNIGHEAVHGTLFKSKKWNQKAEWIFDFIGANGAIWRARHVDSHHPFSNIPGLDSDIKQNPIVRMIKTDKFLSVHRFQHLYMPFVYLIYTLNWLIYRDFKDYFRLFAKKSGANQAFLRLFLGKFFYLSYMLFIPIYFLVIPWTQVLLAFFILQFVGSATTFLVLVSAHVGEDAYFPVSDASGTLNHSWAEHQLLTTTDFATDSFLVTHLFGGFNHHVVHHLFPGVSHMHAPHLTKIVEKIAKKHQVSYNCFDSIPKAILSHFRLLKNNSYPTDWISNADF